MVRSMTVSAFPVGRLTSLATNALEDERREAVAAQAALRRFLYPNAVAVVVFEAWRQLGFCGAG